MAGATVKYEKFDFSIAIGIPFDISMRYYFSNWVGLAVGLQGTVLFSIGRLMDPGAGFKVKGKVGGNEKELYTASIDNKFTVKCELSIRTSW